MVPFRLHSLPVARIWGGRRLHELFGRELPRAADGSTPPIGEYWDVHGSLKVRDGPYQDRSLDHLLKEFKSDLVGSWADSSAPFPLLLKWLDCQDWLSIQVHPDDATAKKLTGDSQALGKNECWYFLETRPGSELLHGWQSGPPDSLTSLAGAEWLRLARRHHPRPGDWLHVPAGTIHALGPGLVLFEVQQSSDLTYRLYDWDRMGLDGTPRELHLEEGRLCAQGFDLPADPENVSASFGEEKVRCPFFLVDEITGSRAWTVEPTSFEIATSLSGTGILRWEGGKLPLSPGDSVVIPASAPAINLEGTDFRWARIRLAPPAKIALA
jgi:mannose-6-phosphate isomerase